MIVATYRYLILTNQSYHIIYTNGLSFVLITSEAADGRPGSNEIMHACTGTIYGVCAHSERAIA